MGEAWRVLGGHVGCPMQEEVRLLIIRLRSHSPFGCLTLCVDRGLLQTWPFCHVDIMIRASVLREPCRGGACSPWRRMLPSHFWPFKNKWKRGTVFSAGLQREAQPACSLEEKMPAPWLKQNLELSTQIRPSHGAVRGTKHLGNRAEE